MVTQLLETIIEQYYQVPLGRQRVIDVHRTDLRVHAGKATAGGLGIRGAEQPIYKNICLPGRQTLHLFLSDRSEPRYRKNGDDASRKNRGNVSSNFGDRSVVNS